MTLGRTMSTESVSGVIYNIHTTLTSVSPLEVSFASHLSNTTSNCSNEEWIYPELERLSGTKATLYTPVIIFLFFLMILGTFGNTLVLYIYCFRSKKRSSNYFIIAMAAFDFMTSTIVMPIDIYDLFFHYSFYSTIMCKIFRTMESATTYASAIILIQIAFDRYFKICKPLRFGNRSRARCMSATAAIVALVLSSPCSVLFGIRREPIKENLCGFDCSIDQKYKGSSFQMIYYVILGLVFLITLVVLSTLYFLIWLAIRRRKGIVIGDNPRNNSINSNNRRRILSISDDDSSSVIQHNPKQGSKRPFRRTFSNISTKSKLSNFSERLSNIKVSRTTKIFIAVTIAFIVSYLPSVAVMICRSVNKNIETESSSLVQVLLKLFSRCHYLNNAVNPIIYSFLNKHFRIEVKKFAKSVGFCCKHRLRPRSWSTSSGSSKKGRTSRSNSVKSERTHEYEMEHLKVSTK